MSARIQRVLKEMQSVPEPQRDAVFYCALALARSGKIVWTIQQQVEGVIAHSPSGTEGFGYDPIFFLPDRGRTMAELDTAEKNRLSARGKALADNRRNASVYCAAPIMHMPVCAAARHKRLLTETR